MIDDDGLMKTWPCLHTYILGVAMRIDYKLGDDDDDDDDAPTSPAAAAADDDPSSRKKKKKKKTATKMMTVQELFQTRQDYGHVDCFHRPWDEVVCEHSPFFPGGRCALDATFTFLTIG